MNSGSSQRSSQQSSNSTQSAQRQTQTNQQVPPHRHGAPPVAAGADGNQRSNILIPEIENFWDFLSRRVGRPGEQPSQGGEGSQVNAPMAGDSNRTERPQLIPQHLLQFFSRLSTAGVSRELEICINSHDYKGNAFSVGPIYHC